ncbi:MAG: hypothetical protein QOJ57_2200 [Thermoleophilaceae bacterium]|jgi:hypothetical protein|nr:hypothetical protein [Thermoleophilaceae bacterium]
MTSQALQDLIATLREQAGRLETLLELTEAQTSAIAARDIERVGRLTATIEREVVDGRTVEERRAGFAAELAAALGRTDGDVTVSGLAEHLRPAEARALTMAADAVVRSVERLGRQSSANRTLLEHELAVIDQVMRIAHRGERTTYSGAGGYDRETVAILDAKA